MSVLWFVWLVDQRRELQSNAVMQSTITCHKYVICCRSLRQRVAVSRSYKWWHWRAHSSQSLTSSNVSITTSFY